MQLIDEVVDNLEEAEDDLREIMEEELEGSFGTDKAGLVASSKEAISSRLRVSPPGPRARR